MTPIDRLEIVCRAFQIDTGLLAPGKNLPGADNADLETRAAVWNYWHRRNWETVVAVLKAVEERE